MTSPPHAWEVFSPYGGLHALAVAVCALLIAAPAWLGRALRPDGEAALRRTLAVLALGYWLAYNIWWNWNGLDWRTGLPLQLCDANGLMAPLALLTGWRWARASLYFWTAALTLQAFIQPALSAGPASPVFWAFWTAHTIIAACAVYDIAVLGFRPGWSDLARALLVSAAYLALVVPVNAWLGSERLRRRSGAGHCGPALRPDARPVAAARDRPGRARDARLRRGALAVALFCCAGDDGEASSGRSLNGEIGS